MEKILGYITLGLFQCILIFSPVIVLPMLIFTALSPVSLFDKYIENRIIFFSQIIFVTGCLLRRKIFRFPLKFVGFTGMVAAYYLVASATDAGGEIGAKDYQGMIISFASGIPFLIAGISMFAVMCFEDENSSRLKLSGVTQKRKEPVEY
jgi:hypothetical protein